MRFIRYTNATGITLGVCRSDEVVDLAVAAPDLPRDLPTLLALGASGSALVQSAIERAPARAVRTRAEIKALVPIAHGEPLRRPRCSDQFDFEGDLACVIAARAHATCRKRTRSRTSATTSSSDAAA